MERFKHFLTEMMQPVSLEQMQYILQSRLGIYADVQESKTDLENYGTPELIVDFRQYIESLPEYAKLRDNIAKGEFVKNKFKEFTKLLSTNQWYVNLVSDSCEEFLIKARDTHAIDKTGYINYNDEIEDRSLYQYGFIHVSKVKPEILLKTGLRAKSSKTYDKHDEKRIYLFPLADTFDVKHGYNDDANVNDISLKTISLMKLSDETLGSSIANMADMINAEFVYYIKKLQKPAKLYHDDRYDVEITNTAVYTKDYNIPAENIEYLGTVDELRKLSEDADNYYRYDLAHLERYFKIDQQFDYALTDWNDDIKNLSNIIKHHESYAKSVIKRGIALLKLKRNITISYDDAITAIASNRNAYYTFQAKLGQINTIYNTYLFNRKNGVDYVNTHQQEFNIEHSSAYQSAAYVVYYAVLHYLDRIKSKSTNTERRKWSVK